MLDAIDHGHREAGVDDTEAYAYGWCAQSERFEAVKLGHRTQRISMIAAWCQRQVVAPLTFTGSCDTALVETWVQQCLVGQLTPGQVVNLTHYQAFRGELVPQNGQSRPTAR